MKNAPEKIYLQVCEENECDADFHDHEEVTWCEEKIHDSDIEYTRKKLKPLAYDDLEQLYIKFFIQSMAIEKLDELPFMSFARAVEAAHGITEAQDGCVH